MAEAAIFFNDHRAHSNVNWLPFGIAYDGSSNATEYFQPSEVQEGASSSTIHYAAHFRGRRLKGVQKQLPEGYQGLILKPCGAHSSRGAADTEQSSWQTCQAFDQLKVWNHDTVPVATDWHVRCIDWLALADKIHAPVDATQVEQELQQMKQQQ